MSVARASVPPRARMRSGAFRASTSRCASAVARLATVQHFGAPHRVLELSTLGDVAACGSVLGQETSTNSLSLEYQSALVRGPVAVGAPGPAVAALAPVSTPTGGHS
jgi:hypothetical protein